MMSLILMINGLLHIVMSGLFFFYTNKYRFLFSQTKLVVFSTFSLYFLFVGFLRVRVSLELDEWHLELLTYDNFTVFNFTNILTSIVMVIFLLYGITFRGQIKLNKNKNENKLD